MEKLERSGQLDNVSRARRPPGSPARRFRSRLPTFRTGTTHRHDMLVLVAGPLVAGHPCAESELRSRSREPAGTHYLRGPTATYATANVRSLPAHASTAVCHVTTPFAHAEAPPPRRAGGGRAS